VKLKLLKKKNILPPSSWSKEEGRECLQVVKAGSKEGGY
jgi:hypothetical protein